MNQFKSFFKELFTEADNFQARSKETGKLVNFKSKASMDAALKAGSHENPNAPKDGKAGGNDSKKDVPKVNIFDKPAASEPAADSMATVKSIAASTGLRATAVAGWADENGVNLSKVADDLKSKKLKPMDFMTAVVGNPNNKYAKDIILKYSQDGGDKSGDYPVGSLQYRLQKNNPKDAVKYDNQLKATIKDIADLTDNNDHNGAVMALAKMMGDKSSTAEMEKIQKYHNLKGHMPQSLIKYRSSILNNLLVQAKKKYGNKFAKQLQNSF